MQRRQLLQAAATGMAEVINREFEAHLGEHGCGTGDRRDPRYVGGFSNCPTAMAMWDLLPDGYRIVFG